MRNCRQADQRLAASPKAAPDPAHNALHGIEFPVAGDHLSDNAIQRQILIPGYREGQRVVFLVLRERIEGNAVLRFHLVP